VNAAPEGTSPLREFESLRSMPACVAQFVSRRYG